MNRTRILPYLTVALLAVFIVGCGAKPMEVTGKITFKGQPVKSGSITFEPIDKKGSSLGGVIENGEYSVVDKKSNDGGKKYVRITCIYSTGRKVPTGPPEPPGTMVDETKMIEFGQKNELTCELQPGSLNEENFDLTSP